MLSSHPVGSLYLGSDVIMKTLLGIVGHGLMSLGESLTWLHLPCSRSFVTTLQWHHMCHH